MKCRNTEDAKRAGDLYCEPIEGYVFGLELEEVEYPGSTEWVANATGQISYYEEPDGSIRIVDFEIESVKVVADEGNGSRIVDIHLLTDEEAEAVCKAVWAYVLERSFPANSI